MAKRGLNLLELDVEKLFEERKVEDIVEIAKLLDVEIEKKRVELRSMVGDRYKDVLTASDQIKDMKKISEGIVENIQKIADSCEFLVNGSETVVAKPQPAVVERIEERSIVIQIRLIMILNEQIWTALDGNDHLLAAELCLFAEHIYTGLSLLKDEFRRKFPILLRIRETTNSLRSRILKNVKEKLQSVTLTAEELGNNLNSLVLLENQGTSDLLDTFVNQRKIALSTVINSSHSSVRVQVSSMVHCLIATVHLLHDCFIRTESVDKGLIWQQLEQVVGDNAPNTITKVELPTTPLLMYIPAITKEFRPKCLKIDNNHKDEIKRVTKEWLEVTTDLVQKGLNSLDLVTNLRGLHIIREEALKIDIPKNWKTVCSEINLPGNFSVWYYYFQKSVTQRAEDLISKKIAANLQHLQEEVVKRLQDFNTLEESEKICLWDEEVSESSRKKGCFDLSMKTNGFSKTTVKLCEKFDTEFLELLKDVHVYLYGKEYEGSTLVLPFKEVKMEIKFVDREKLESALRISCRKHSDRLIDFLEGRLRQETDRKAVVAQSLACARLLQGILNLCPNFQKSCTFSGVNTEWTEVCNNFSRSNLKLWRNWVNNSNFEIEKSAHKLLEKTEHKDMLQVLPKWETIEIQEQADDKIVKSQIKVPSHPSLPLYDLLLELNTNVNEILPHTLPKQIHVDLIESCMEKILNQYSILVNNDLHQTQALQFLFDVKFITTLCISRENVQLVGKSQTLCDTLRSKIDPFDLDVFYSYLQNNVQKCVYQSQMLFGCLVPSTAQLASIGVPERSKEHERDPSLLALSIPTTNSWFTLLPVSAPTHKTATALQQRENNKDVATKAQKTLPKKQEAASSVRSGAAALWSGLANDWFS